MKRNCLCLTIHNATALHLFSGCTLDVTSTVLTRMHVRSSVLEAPGNKASQHVSGARGVVAPVPRTGQCRHEWAPRTHERKEHSLLQADRKQPSVVTRFPGHSAVDKIVETPGATECKVPTLQSRAKVPTDQTVLKDWQLSSRSYQRGHQDPCLGAEADRIQKIVEIPQLEYTDEKVDITAESSEDSADDAGPVHRETG